MLQLFRAKPGNPASIYIYSIVSSFILCSSYSQNDLLQVKSDIEIVRLFLLKTAKKTQYSVAISQPETSTEMPA